MTRNRHPAPVTLVSSARFQGRPRDTQRDWGWMPLEGFF